jgi:hypothetical protein
MRWLILRRGGQGVARTGVPAPEVQAAILERRRAQEALEETVQRHAVESETVYTPLLNARREMLANNHVVDALRRMLREGN